MDLDRLYHLLIVLSLFFFSIAILGLIGEHLGWWNDTGELLISLGTAGGVATGVAAIIVGSTRGQVRRVADGVEANGSRLDHLGAQVDNVGEKVDNVGQKVEDVGEKVDSVVSRLGTLDEHVVQQHDVLIQIRDRL